MGVESAVKPGGAQQSEQTSRAIRPITPILRRSRRTPPVAGPRAIISLSVLVGVVAGLDLLLLAAAGGLAVATAPTGWAPGRLIVSFAVGLYVTSAALRALSAYRIEHLSRLGAVLRIVLLSVLCGTAGLVLVAWLLRGGADEPLDWTLRAGAAAVVALAVWRAGLVGLLAVWRANGRFTRHVAVIGANDYSRSFIEAIGADPASGLSVVGLYDDRLNRLSPAAALPVQGDVRTLVAEARERRIDVIVVALPLSAHARIAEIREKLSPTVADIFLTADTAGLRYDGRDFEALGRNGVIRVASRPLGDVDAAVKSAFDRVGAAVLLTLLSPLLLGLAALIRLDSPGPALFRQPRTGFNNRPFAVLKFRSMYAHLGDLHADRQTTRGDHRITRLGRFLRRSSLDELPQLINVLRGEMSLVGPRPHAANTKAEDRYFDEVVADYALRHRIKPGITGWAQVNGWRGETALVEQIEQRVAHDLSYIENWSLLLDLRILWMTVFGRGARRNAF